MQTNKPILDMCCGSRMFMHDKQDPRVLFMDIRSEEHILCDGRILKITPDIIADFKNLPFPDETFYQVLFDPPHLVRVGKNSWMFKKYGALDKHSWRSDLATGFREGSTGTYSSYMSLYNGRYRRSGLQNLCMPHSGH